MISGGWMSCELNQQIRGWIDDKVGLDDKARCKVIFINSWGSDGQPFNAGGTPKSFSDPIFMEFLKMPVWNTVSPLQPEDSTPKSSWTATYCRGTSFAWHCPKAQCKSLSRSWKRCHAAHLWIFHPLTLIDCTFFRKNHPEARESITWSQFQAPLLRFHSWWLTRSPTVRHSSVGSRKKIETNSIYLRYTNGTRFTSPQTCCKRAQTYINQTHSKEVFLSKKEVFRCLFM